jgi:hypothetical protein
VGRHQCQRPEALPPKGVVASDERLRPLFGTQRGHDLGDARARFSDASRPRKWAQYCPWLDGDDLMPSLTPRQEDALARLRSGEYLSKSYKSSIYWWSSGGALGPLTFEALCAAGHVKLVPHPLVGTPEWDDQLPIAVWVYNDALLKEKTNA